MINKIENFFKKALKVKKYKYFFIIQKFNKSFLFLFYTLLIFSSFFFILMMAPKLLDYEKRESIIRNSLIKSHNLDIGNISKMSYLAFPSPRLEIKKINLKSRDNSLNLDSANLLIPINPFNLYTLQEIKIKKILVKKSNLSLEAKNFKKFLQYLKNLDNKIFIKQSNFVISSENKKLIVLNNVIFNNQNKKNFDLDGMLLKKKININFFEHKGKNRLTINLPQIAFKVSALFNSGSNIESSSGEIMATILNNKIKFNFKKAADIQISNSFFRNNLINTSFDGKIYTNPHFLFDLNFNIKDLNINSFVDILFSKYSNKIDEILKINKKINGSFKFSYKNKKFYNHSLASLYIPIVLKNGNIELKNALFQLEKEKLTLSGILRNDDDYQRFNFNMIYNLANKKDFYKRIKIKSKGNDSSLNINIDGSLSLSSNKINISKIIINGKNNFDEQKLNFYKENFENLVINESILGILKSSNLKEFIKNIY